MQIFHPPGELPPLKRAKTYVVPEKTDAVSTTKASAGSLAAVRPRPHAHGLCTLLCASLRWRCWTRGSRSTRMV
eukprot:3521669-Amphidinium_carterae.1